MKAYNLLVCAVVGMSLMGLASGQCSVSAPSLSSVNADDPYCNRQFMIDDAYFTTAGDSYAIGRVTQANQGDNRYYYLFKYSSSGTRIWGRTVFEQPGNITATRLTYPGAIVADTSRTAVYITGEFNDNFSNPSAGVYRFSVIKFSSNLVIGYNESPGSFNCSDYNSSSNLAHEAGRLNFPIDDPAGSNQRGISIDVDPNGNIWAAGIVHDSSATAVVGVMKISPSPFAVTWGVQVPPPSGEQIVESGYSFETYKDHSVFVKFDPSTGGAFVACRLVSSSDSSDQDYGLIKLDPNGVIPSAWNSGTMVAFDRLAHSPDPFDSNVYSSNDVTTGLTVTSNGDAFITGASRAHNSTYIYGWTIGVNGANGAALSGWPDGSTADTATLTAAIDNPAISYISSGADDITPSIGMDTGQHPVVACGSGGYFYVRSYDQDGSVRWTNNSFSGVGRAISFQSSNTSIRVAGETGSAHDLAIIKLRQSDGCMFWSTSSHFGASGQPNHSWKLGIDSSGNSRVAGIKYDSTSGNDAIVVKAAQ